MSNKPAAVIIPLVSLFIASIAFGADGPVREANEAAQLTRAVQAPKPIAGQVIEDEVKSKLGGCPVYNTAKFKKKSKRAADLLGNGTAVPGEDVATYIPGGILRDAYKLLSRPVVPLDDTSIRALFLWTFPGDTAPTNWADFKTQPDPDRVLNAGSVGLSPETALYADMTTVVYRASCLAAANAALKAGVKIPLADLQGSLDTTFEESAELLLLYGDFFSPIHQALYNAPGSVEEASVNWAVWQLYTKSEPDAKFQFVKSLRGWVVASASTHQMQLKSQVSGTGGGTAGMASLSAAVGAGVSSGRSASIHSFTILPLADTAPIFADLPSAEAIYDRIDSSFGSDEIIVSRTDKATERSVVTVRGISEWGCNSGFEINDAKVESNSGGAVATLPYPQYVVQLDTKYSPKGWKWEGGECHVGLVTSPTKAGATAAVVAFHLDSVTSVGELQPGIDVSIAITP